MTSRTGRTAWCTLLILLLIGAGTARADSNPQIEVEVQGVSGDLQKNVLAYLSIETYHDNANLTQSLVDRLNARAPEEIRKALEPFGYYDAQVVTDLTATANGWHAKYVVTPGIPVRIRKVDIQLSGTGKDDDAFKDYLSKLPLKSGDQLDQPTYENIKQQLQDLAAHCGYIDARFTDSVLRVDPPGHWADIELRFDTGLRYYFGQVTFTQDFMQSEFLQRYVSFKPGDPYDASQLLNLQYVLSDSDYFGSVDVQVLRKQT
ncbi:MAG: autotransporter assembly complex protein TamA, partial [Gammaproteobacteria bacterium]